MTTASAVTGTILEYRNDITKHFNLSKNNDWLQKENIRLRKMLKQSRISVDSEKGEDSNVVRIDELYGGSSMTLLPQPSSILRTTNETITSR